MKAVNYLLIGKLKKNLPAIKRMAKQQPEDLQYCCQCGKECRNVWDFLFHWVGLGHESKCLALRFIRHELFYGGYLGEKNIRLLDDTGLDLIMPPFWNGSELDLDKVIEIVGQRPKYRARI